MAAGNFDNVREILGGLIGHTVVDITQHDADEYEHFAKQYIQLAFDNGDYVRFYIGDDGFDHSVMEKIDDTQTG